MTAAVVAPLRLVQSAPAVETAEQLLAAYETWLRSWDASERTIDSRIKVLRSRNRAWGDPATVTTVMIQEWFASSDFATWTKVTYAGHLSSWFGWLHDTERIASNPMAKVRKARDPERVPRPLSPEEVEQVLRHAKRHVRAYVRLALFAGLRAHEIAKIRGEDVTEDHVFVHGKGNKQALIPTHPVIWELAQSYPRQGYWFPNREGDGPVRRHTISNSTTRLFTRLGIEGSIHRCRHTYCTLLLRAGVNIRVVQTLARHSSLATTAGYCAVDEDERRAAVNLLGGLS